MITKTGAIIPSWWNEISGTTRDMGEACFGYLDGVFISIGYKTKWVYNPETHEYEKEYILDEYGNRIILGKSTIYSTNVAANSIPETYRNNELWAINPLI